MFKNPAAPFYQGRYDTNIKRENLVLNHVAAVLFKKPDISIDSLLFRKVIYDFCQLICFRFL